MKISINRRYVTKGSMSSSPKIAFCVKDLGTQKYYAVEGQPKIYVCNEFGINQEGEDKFNLVAPYKPTRREPKVGDHVEYVHKAFQGAGHIEEIGFNCIRVNSAGWINRRQIVKFLNKECGK